VSKIKEHSFLGLNLTQSKSSHECDENPTTAQGHPSWSIYNLGGRDRGIETILSQFPQLWKILLFLATRQEENVGSLVDLDSIIRPKTVIVRVGNHQ
jgi:hypothetical protein